MYGASFAGICFSLDIPRRGFRAHINDLFNDLLAVVDTKVTVTCKYLCIKYYYVKKTFGVYYVRIAVKVDSEIQRSHDII